MDEAVGTMAIRASGPPARLTNAERMSLSRSLSSAPPMAITGPAVTMPSGPDAAGSVATLSLIALPATPATPPHLQPTPPGITPAAVSSKYGGHGYDLASGVCRVGFHFWVFSLICIHWLYLAELYRLAVGEHTKGRGRKGLERHRPRCHPEERGISSWFRSWLRGRGFSCKSIGVTQVSQCTVGGTAEYGQLPASRPFNRSMLRRILMKAILRTSSRVKARSGSGLSFR